MPVKYVLFDIDDTLFPSTDFAQLARKNAIRAMVDMGLEKDPDILYRKLLTIIDREGSNYEGHFDRLCKSLRLKKPARFVAAAVAAYHNTKMSIQPFPGVARSLMKLKESGYMLYVATNGSTIKQWDKLIRLRIAFYFDDVFVSEEMGRAKSKKFFNDVLRRLDAEPGECVMVGDKEAADILPAKELGITTVKVRQGREAREKTSADYRIGHAGEIRSVLERL